VRHGEHPPADDYEQELVQTVGSGTDRWLTELRLAVIGIIISVALGAADIALSLSTWQVALAAGVACTLVFAGLLWRLRPRARTRREPANDDLRRIGRELAQVRDALADDPRGPLRELLETLQSEIERLQKDLERAWNDLFVETASADRVKLLRTYEGEVHELTAELRCRRAGA
jgi:uncharacterized membrane protein YfbV (UPF0208 family)